MGSRKDLIKRSLGITEYPWSSDDDLEEAPPVEEDTSHNRPPGELRPSTADFSGPSGMAHQQQQSAPPQPAPQAPLSQVSQLSRQQMDNMQQMHQLQQQQVNEHQQQQQATARRNQARMDRDLFWSIINSPQRIPIHGSRSRGDAPVSYVSRMNHVPAPELRERPDRPAAAEIQRILAFKRLTRNLNSLRHRGHITGVIPVTRVNPGVIVPSEVNSGIRINRHIPIRRFVRAGTGGPPPPPHHEANDRNHAPSRLHTPHGGPRASRYARAPAAPVEPETSRAPSHLPQNMDEVNNNPIIPTEDEIGDEEENVEQDVPLEGEIENDVASDHSSPPAPLEEEIVTIDMDNNDAQPQVVVDDEQAHETRAGTSAAGDAPGPTEARFSPNYPRADDDNPMPSTSGTTAETNPQQQPSQGIKRKRRDSDDSIDPCSVREFNMNLLRLLECPVCLEWMEPPMSQCRRGHLVCVRCRARLASCPVCRTTFSSVRNRAMEGVAEMLRYPCRHGCGREVRLRRRAPHEASCAARKYQCPAPPCADGEPLPRNQLAQHFQSPVTLNEGTAGQASAQPLESGGTNTLPLSENDEETLLSPDPRNITVQNPNAEDRDSPLPDIPMANDPGDDLNVARALQQHYDAMNVAAPAGIILQNEPISAPVEYLPPPNSERSSQHANGASFHSEAPQGFPDQLPNQHGSEQASRVNFGAFLPPQEYGVARALQLYYDAMNEVRNPESARIRLQNEELQEPLRRADEFLQRSYEAANNLRRTNDIMISIIEEVVQAITQFDLERRIREQQQLYAARQFEAPRGVPINLSNQPQQEPSRFDSAQESLRRPSGSQFLQRPYDTTNNLRRSDDAMMNILNEVVRAISQFDLERQMRQQQFYGSRPHFEARNPINLSNQPPVREQSFLQRTIEQPSQAPYGPPNFGMQRSVPTIPVRMPERQGLGYRTPFSYQPGSIPQPFSGHQFQPQYNPGSGHHNGAQLSYDRTPYLTALREQASQVTREFRLRQVGGRPLLPQNGGHPTQQPLGIAGVQGQMQAPNIAYERFWPPVPGGNPPAPEPPLQAENNRPATNGVLSYIHDIYNYHAMNTSNQRRHLTMMKIGRRHRFSMKVNSEQHDNWLILALEEYFHLRIDVDVRTWGVVVYVSYIGPKCDARNFTYEVTVDGQHNQRKLVYSRATHSDLESSSLNVSRQDCFHLTLDQALNFIRFKNRHCDADKFLDFNVEIKKADQAVTQRDESDS